MATLACVDVMMDARTHIRTRKYNARAC
jgi:hypothetical protein